MGTIQIRNIPDETVKALKVRAANSGQSLQEYMRDYLIAESEKPTVEELMEQIRSSHDATKPDLPLEVTLQGIDETWE
jgi:plasmid stability protein